MNPMEQVLLRLVRRSWRLYDSLSFNVRILTPEGPLYVPIRKRVGLGNLTPFEKAMVEVARKISAFRRGTFLDVGANIGKVLLTLLSVDRSIPYLGFEPNLVCCAYVEDLIAANGLKNHSILPIGLSDANTAARLLMNGHWDVSASTVAAYRGSKTYAIEKPVYLGIGDDVLEQLNPGPIAAIKVDVEGAEAQVLTGLSKTIDADRPILVIEVLPYAHLESGSYSRKYFGDIPASEIPEIVRCRKDTAERIGRFLADRSYRAALMRQDGTFTPVESLDQGSRTDFKEINFLAVPQESSANFGM